MATRFARFRFVTAAAIGFIVGVYFASGMDLPRLSWAQDSSSPASTAGRGPSAPEEVGSFADVAERVTPGVVSVRTVRNARPVQMRGRVPQGMEDFLEQFGGPPRQQRPQSGEGSGFLVSKDGYIVTNHHVIADADQVTVVLSDRRSFRAKVVGSDSTTDVAVLKIDGRDFPTLPLGNDERVRIGDWVLAVGNPLGLEFTVTAGIISAKGRGAEIRLPNSGNFTISDFIQTDAAINPGNSGGPLLNVRGEVIGLNSAIASNTGFYSGYGFAIPITLVQNVMEQLISDGRVRLPVMGVLVQPVDEDDAGVNGLPRITGVKVGGFNPPDGGPAKTAGIEVGDIITTVDGKEVDRVSALQRIVRAHKVGDVVPVEVLRFGSRKSFKVKLVEAETAPRVASAESPSPVVPPTGGLRAGKLGITVEPLDPQLARQQRLPTDRGVRIREVMPNSPAASKLIEGDVILEIMHPAPRKVVRSVDDLSAVVGALKDGDYLSLLVQSPDPRIGTRVVNLRVGD
jgi:serine protease Do